MEEKVPLRRSKGIIEKEKRIEDSYLFGQEIGEGSFSRVLQAIQKSTLSNVAIKIIDKTVLTARQKERVYSEIETLSILHHPNIVNMIEAFESEEYLYLVMELKMGGELFDRIITKGVFTEKEAKFTLEQVGRAVAYLHKKGIVHRDLKPENLLFDTISSDSKVCLADFGFAKFVADNDTLNTPCGTPGYVAPEIANAEEYKKGVDMWSVGVIMYTLVCGFPPFYSDDDEELLDLISSGQFSFPNPWWKNISEDAKDLIKHLLDKNPGSRYTAEQFLSHPWFQSETIVPSSAETIQRSERINKKEFKNALNLSIIVNREGTFLRAASESTLWKKRQQKNKITQPIDITSLAINTANTWKNSSVE